MSDERTGEVSNPERLMRRRSSDRRIRESAEQSTLARDSPEVTTNNLPDLDILGQIDDTYIVAASPSGLVLIDQHAADERIHFERLLSSFEEDTGTQTLLHPVDVSLTPEELDALTHLRSPLEELGFDFTFDDDRRIVVTGVPTVVDAHVDPEVIQDVVNAMLADVDPNAPIEKAAKELLGDLACYPAITGHTRMATGSMVELLETLDGCDNPYACPHGRPVFVRIDYDELEDRFERDYPGHSVRRSEHWD